MIKRYYVTLGASTTANGKVISANQFDTINDVPIALERDKCWCPECNSEGMIVLDGPRLSETSDGREVALSDDLCVCKCNPPPRLVATQNFAYQIVDADWHASEANEAAETAAELNTAERKPPATDGIPLVLLNLETQEPFKNLPYRLELTDKMIDGTTDQNGATRPLTAEERASFIKWHVDDLSA